ncbi:MAG TPA: hypothetical protein VIK52_08780, partial [Opitutaceae bacterium]
MRLAPLTFFVTALSVLLTPAALARTLSIVEAPGLGAPARHGLEKFEAAVRAQGWEVEEVASVESAGGDGIVMVGLAFAIQTWPSVPEFAHPLDAPEAFAVKKFSIGGKPAVLFAGADNRGLMYALLEAAASIAVVSGPAELLDAIRDVEEKPAIRDRALSVYTMNRDYWESRFY